jgi:hypothetical protein
VTLPWSESPYAPAYGSSYGNSYGPNGRYYPVSGPEEMSSDLDDDDFYPIDGYDNPFTPDDGMLNSVQELTMMMLSKSRPLMSMRVDRSLPPWRMIGVTLHPTRLDRFPPVSIRPSDKLSQGLISCSAYDDRGMLVSSLLLCFPALKTRSFDRTFCYR